jgi:c-di-GMP-binding flagellar brake protein YcgR
MSEARDLEVRRVVIAHNRRRNRRYGIQLELRWKLTSRKKVLDQGTGRTLDVSSGGLQFETSRPLPVGESVELSVDWPVMLHNIKPLQLVVAGTIVRSSGKHTAVQMGQFEFRTILHTSPSADHWRPLQP